MSSSDNIDQRVGLLESLLLTLTPALSALANSADRSNEISNLVSEIRAHTSAHPTDLADGNDENITSEMPSQENELSLHAIDLPTSPTVVVPPQNISSDISTDHGQLLVTPSIGSHQDPGRKAKSSKIKVKVTCTGNDPPLRTRFHRAHSAGKIGSYAIRYHSSSKADLIFDDVSDAERAHQCISSEVAGVDVSLPTCTNTKMVHIVGLTEDDTKDSVYTAISKPGRNHAIEHLLNPYTFRVLGIKPCNKDRHVYRASVAVSEEIWNIILHKMDRKLKIDYLSCVVYLRPDSIRCYQCQRLGHTSQTCNEDATCVVCGEKHVRKDCQNSPKCINCFELGFDHNHSADSPTCLAYQNFRKGSPKN